MHRAVIYPILALACLLQQGLTAVAAQDQSEARLSRSGAAEVPKPGRVDGDSSPALTGVRHPLYRLRRSDVVELSFTFSPQFDQQLTIQPDGFVTLKGIGQLYAEGKTVPEFEDAVRLAYTGTLHDPEVSVLLKDFDKPSFIAAGEVNRPGKYELRAETTVTEAVAIAGGFTPRSKHSQVVLFRRVSQGVVESHLLNIKSLLQSRSLQEDIYLRPGDLLFVPQNLISKIRQFMPASNLSLYANPTGF